MIDFEDSQIFAPKTEPYTSGIYCKTIEFGDGVDCGDGRGGGALLFYGPDCALDFDTWHSYKYCTSLRR